MNAKRTLKFEPGGPVCPDYLSPEAAAHFAEIVESLKGVVKLIAADADALAMYCAAFVRWEEAERHLEKEGCVIRGKINPWFKISCRCAKQLSRIGKQLGLSPLSRYLITGK
jgi:P27 family predicted phage terminase small subunit